MRLVLPGLVDGVWDLPRWLGARIAENGWWLAAGSVAVGAGVVAVHVWWRRQAQAALRERCAVELVPSVTFDPADAEVEWFAGQVASVRSAAGALPVRAAATRVRLTCTAGEMHYLLEGPARAASLLRMPGFEQVEVVAASAGAPSTVGRIRFEGAPPLPADTASLLGGVR
ncbi:hypothetical protein [Streptantibioticus ferralitis]|uniref:Uncharacterized protein n=1 Tax=Streptantibioticus ferralitis TaxID=236510 RepID=A0ABT5Z779_9ACTN|nr:hypothetical protein [Streptantibioticus ferralitis]MDF2259690.1 hypothetical protein [Streptantibioticus ferralitis]